ncbi:MAG: hypothetical protein V1853_05720 [bacterium]
MSTQKTIRERYSAGTSALIQSFNNDEVPDCQARALIHAIVDSTKNDTDRWMAINFLLEVGSELKPIEVPETRQEARKVLVRHALRGLPDIETVPDLVLSSILGCINFFGCSLAHCDFQNRDLQLLQSFLGRCLDRHERGAAPMGIGRALANAQAWPILDQYTYLADAIRPLYLLLREEYGVSQWHGTVTDVESNLLTDPNHEFDLPISDPEKEKRQRDHSRIRALCARATSKSYCKGGSLIPRHVEAAKTLLMLMAYNELYHAPKGAVLPSL